MMHLKVMWLKDNKNKENVYLMTRLTHFIYGQMALYHLVSDETLCYHFMGYSF